MEINTAWNTFLKTGKVEDYLNYKKSQNTYTSVFMPTEGEPADDPDNNRRLGDSSKGV